jgi:opacity protein-like surface antigen
LEPIPHFRPAAPRSPIAGVASVKQNGPIGGAEAGYNYQWGASFVAGVEADLQGAGVRGAGRYAGASQDGAAINYDFEGDTGSAVITRSAFGSGQITAGVDWLGTVRGRIGWLAAPTLLVFGTGGLAYGGVHASAFHSIGIVETATASGVLSTVPETFLTVGGKGAYSNMQVGWSAGAGLEWMFAPDWSVKAEALYYNLGGATIRSSAIAAYNPDYAAASFTSPLMSANSAMTRVKFDGVIARVGINYHFNWGAAPGGATY